MDRLSILVDVQYALKQLGHAIDSERNGWTARQQMDAMCRCKDALERTEEALGRPPLDEDTRTGQYGESFRLVAFDIHWEGEPIVCAECNAEIESAYGVPDSED